MRVFLAQLGCRLNFSENSTLAGRLNAVGHRIVGRPEDAQVIVLNTCAVTSQAARKSRQAARHLNKRNPAARIAMTGCYATLAPQESADLPGVELVADNHAKEMLHTLLGEAAFQTGMRIYFERHDGQAVTTDLAARIPASVELAFLALLIGVPGGVATGVIAARYRDRFADFGLRFSSLLAIATPEFLFGIFAIWLFFAVLNWAPAPLGRIEFGISPPEAITGLYIVDSVLTRNTEALVSSLRSIALPAISLGVILAGGFQRFTRATMVESLSSDAVLSSRGHGLPNRLVFYKYSLKQALLVVVPVFGIVVAYAIGGLVAVERIFSWPGVGRYALEAVSRADLNAVQGFILFSVVLYVALNLFVDIVQAIIDPRIEYR